MTGQRVMTFLAVLLPVLALTVVLANWLMLREARRRLPTGTRRERAHFVIRAWNTAGLSLMTETRDSQSTIESVPEAAVCLVCDQLLDPPPPGYYPTREEYERETTPAMAMVRAMEVMEVHASHATAGEKPSV